MSWFAARAYARYARRVGLSSARITHYDGERVTFVTKAGRTVTITGVELVRRLALHVLPRGFVRLRHHGLFTARHRIRLAVARQRIAELGVGCGFAEKLEGDDAHTAELADDAAWEDVARCRFVGQGAPGGPSATDGPRARPPDRRRDDLRADQRSRPCP